MINYVQNAAASLLSEMVNSANSWAVAIIQNAPSQKICNQ